MFLGNHPKRPKLPYGTAAKSLRKLKAFVTKMVKIYLEVGNMDDSGKRVNTCDNNEAGQ